MNKRVLHKIIALIGVLGIILALVLNQINTLNPNQLAKKTLKIFELKHQKCSELLELALEKQNNELFDLAFDAFGKEQIGLYIFNQDSLTFWNNARWPFIDSLNLLKNDFGLLKQKEGLYFYVKKSKSNQSAFALVLIRSQFEIQNNYLKNEYSNWTSLPKQISISEKLNTDLSVQIKNQFLFSIQTNESTFYNVFYDDLSSILFLLGYTLILLAALVFIYSSNNSRYAFLVLIIVVAIRFVLLFFKYPSFLYRTALFDLHVFGNGQSLFNGYLGDVLFNAIIVLIVALSLHIYWQKNKINRMNWSQFVLQILGIAFVFFQYNINLKSLVSNSTLSFDFSNIFSNNWLLLAVFASYAAYALALFVFLIAFIKNIFNHQLNFILLCSISIGISLAYYFLFSVNHFIEVVWLIYFNLFVYWVYKYSKHNLVLALGLMVILVSFTSSALLHINLRKNQAFDLQLLAQQISEKKDAILESEYSVLPEKIKRDDNFINLINLIPSTEREVIQKLKQDYFSGYFDRYNLDYSLFDNQCNPLLPVKNPVLVNQGFFEDQIKQQKDSLGNGLYFLSNTTKPVRYIAYIPLKDKRLYVLMEPKQFEETGSFPDLLIDQSLQKQNKLRNVSFAVYHSGLLSNRTGDFIYPDYIQDSLGLANNNPNYEHFYYNTDEGTKVIISQSAKNWKYLFTFNSYILLFFSAFIYLSYLVYTILFTSVFANSSLTRRIQTIIILLLLFSMSAVGIISGNLVSKQFEFKNQKQLSEKTQIIISELTNQFKLNQLFDVDQYDLINLKLKEYARLFNTPITMFNGNAQLINTSENKLYDLGLASKLASPQAFHQLRDFKATSICVNEKAGALDYMSMYTAIFDSNKNLIGIINLPYFAKQNDLSNELSNIISALINVYVILFVLSILAGLILSGYITQPLRLIQQQIAKITLGKQNEKIVWNSKDEIGKLVYEYNQMLIKLEDSANQLAQSERESAWREMAKQVAHEIKNPLTPMKLNLQYLQHLMKSNADDFADKFEKASAGIIEQIDSLANIATEFSNFAKLPGTQLQNINLAEIIAASTNLFQNQDDGSIKNLVNIQSILVKGDRDQCLRVFNNVIKNALQAVEEVSKPEININAEITDTHIIVSIKDNGCGINDDLKPKLFSPNFTTKSTGSGLGLAMVKSCMLGFGGDVYFESESKIGSTFYLKFVRV